MQINVTMELNETMELNAAIDISAHTLRRNLTNEVYTKSASSRITSSDTLVNKLINALTVPSSTVTTASLQSKESQA